MVAFDLPQLVDLYTKEVAIVNALWTVYVVATFAAAGAGYSSKVGDMPLMARLAVTLGFWAFTLGHLHLLRQGLAILKSVASAILTTVSAEGTSLSSDTANVLRVLALTSNRTWVSVLIHLFIDICVTLSLWSAFILR